MNKSLLILVIITGTFFMSCKSSQQKEATAKQKVIEANQDLIDIKISNANEWLALRRESRVKILDNEKKIAELKIMMEKPGSTFDGLYRTRVEKLEAKNTELNSKLAN